MICYRDMTFCPFDDCRKFGSACVRSLTPDVEKAAEAWWGSKDAPICTFVDKPECFEESEDV